MPDVSFARPWLLWLIALVPIAYLAVSAARLQSRRALDRWGSAGSTARPGRAARVRFGGVALLAALLSLGGLAAAAAGPRVEVTRTRDAATVMLAIDRSRSMSRRDVPPDRITAARDAASQFLTGLDPRYRAGLVTFASTASVDAPPSLDRAPAVAALGRISLQLQTAVGDAVLQSLAAVRTDRGARPGDPLPGTRILLLTDGAQTIGASLQSAAEAASRAGVPVDTIALGVDNAAATGALTSLSTATGGRSLRADDPAGLAAAYADLGQALTRERVPRDLAGWTAAAALALLVLAALAIVAGTPRARPRSRSRRAAPAGH